jgi:hypothetical protein
MDPLVTSSIIGAGANLLGGLFGSSAQSKANRLYKKSLAQAQSQFDAQMDESIQRRVADAQAAGIHPLFALGASPAGSPTISAGSPPSQGNAMGDAVARMGEMLAIIPMNKARAKRDEAEAMYYRSLAAKTTQDLASQGRDAFGNPSGAGVRTFPVPDREPLGEAVYISPVVAKSKAVGVRAGTEPGTIDAIMPDGRKINLISPDLNMDEISQIDYLYQRAVHKGADAMTALDAAVRKATRNRPIRQRVKWKDKKRSWRTPRNRSEWLRFKYL